MISNYKIIEHTDYERYPWLQNMSKEFYVLFVSIVLFCVLFMCKCVLYHCHRMATQLQLNISYIISYHIISHHIIYHTISYHIISYHIISHHFISYLTIPFHTIQYHTLYHIITYKLWSPLYWVLPGIAGVSKFRLAARRHHQCSQ